MRSATPSLRARLRDGEQLVGALVRMPAEDVIDMLGVSGMDFVLIDCEHGPADVLALRQHIAMAEVHGMAVVVRTGTYEPALVLRALDQGAQGIVAPHIDSVEDARALVASAHYPPLGGRGFATYPRAGGFGTVSAEEHRERAATETLVIAMIESPEAVRASADILAVDGVDGFLVGTADLAASSAAGDPSIADAVSRVRAAGQASGAWRCDLAGDVDGARGSLDTGAQLVVYNLAQVLMGVFARLRISP